MASGAFKPSRIVAVGVVLAAALWIGSGVFGQEHADGGAEGGDQAAIPVQKVGVATATPEMHRRDITLSCVTQADHKAAAVARGGGVITALEVSRGDVVKSGDAIGRISDEGRKAAVDQAEALLQQRLAEYNANKKLIDTGDAPRNNLTALEAAVAAAKAAVSAAQAELDKVTILSPLDGRVDDLTVQVGQAVQPGTEIAEVVDPDPMLAVGAVSEARRGSLAVGQDASVRFLDNAHVAGKINFVSLSADTGTRTYRVEARMDNADAAIPDGVTCEMTVELEGLEATAVPRSALIFSDGGQLGVRVVDGESRVRFIEVQVVDDARDVIWLTGLTGETKVIVVGQDFVKDGDVVEAVPATEADVPAESPA